MNVIDQNTQALGDFYFQQEVAHQHWLDSLPEKYEAIIRYAVCILKGDITEQEYEWVFSEYFPDEIEWQRLASVISDWNTFNVSIQDYDFMSKVAQTALNGASEILYDTPLGEILEEGNFSLTKMIVEVME
jgi:hypothetical protein